MMERKIVATAATLTALGFLAWAAFGSHSNYTLGLLAAGFALGAAVDLFRGYRHDR